MLVELRVHDFVLIDSLELRLEPGYNVLTGETGAGKSIIVGALELVLGGRASSDLIRPGAAEAGVEALFDASSSPAVLAQLEAMGAASDSELVVRRVVQPGGRSRAYVNGRLCTARELQAIARELADVTSQHESVALADASRHLTYLDRWAGARDGLLASLRRELGERVDALLAVHRELARAMELGRGRAERADFLRFQLEAIDALAPRAGELEDLAAERGRLRHADRLRAVTAGVAAALEDNDPGLCDQLGRLSADLAASSELDPLLEAQARELDDCWSRLRDLARELGRYAERVEADPGKLEQVQERLYRLEELLRRHGPTLDEVLATRARMDAELGELAGLDQRVPEMQARREALSREAESRALELSDKRRAAARTLGEAISRELGELGMGAARVLVEVQPASPEGAELTVAGSVDGAGPRRPAAKLTREGIDRVQFLIAPNRGVEPRPIGRIASGGELSRALLALKRALCCSEGGVPEGGAPENRSAGIQVFDEVDAGVGGATADKIGRAIAGVATQRQVLCITHLASIAAYADAHFVVAKEDRSGSTTSRIERVDGKARIAEIARMLTGASLTPASLRAARELLAAARPARVAA